MTINVTPNKVFPAYLFRANAMRTACADEWFGLSTRVSVNEFISLLWHFDVNWMTANNHFGKTLTIFVHLFSQRMRIKWWLRWVFTNDREILSLVLCVCVRPDDWLWFSGLMMGGNMICSGAKDYCITASGGQVHAYFMVCVMEQKMIRQNNETKLLKKDQSCGAIVIVWNEWVESSAPNFRASSHNMKNGAGIA